MESPSHFEFHLPLGAIDQVNKPPLYYLWLQDGCIIVAGLLWTMAYVLYIIQARKDKSYGMPLIALCANISWEITYGLFYPLSYVETAAFILWLLLDLGIVLSTVKFGTKQWRHPSLVARRIPTILVIGCGLSLLIHWQFIEALGSRDEAAFWSGFACQNLLGTLSVMQIISRGNTSGHSWSIWLCRWIGSSLAIVLYCWRYYHYPESYPFAGSSVAVSMFILMEIVDLAYAVMYMRLAGQVKEKAQ
ncbi:hypothetical protein F4777DRAFT_447358 [Nemania sp. FL0916]|nr:hypothetical protein F4777DRAFT_447358 [Nemania sp. FL0916]